ncbi:MAG: DUF3226 domain-containing protein [Cyanobacteria bacterium P01_C01_bin.72]
MPKSSKSKLKPQQLLVEGNSDKQVIKALCEPHNILDLFSFAFPTQGGVENLLKNLPIKLDEANLKTLGVVVDADQDLAARWQSLISKLRDFGYKNIPQVPPENGWVHTQVGKPKIGVWVMPNNQLPGMLEDFVSYLIPPEDRLQEKVVALLNKIEVEELNLYSLPHRQKAFIHSWLALQEKPGRPMGQAITAKALAYDSAISRFFVDWLKYLFEMEN